MLTFLLGTALVLAALGLGTVALPVLVIGAVIWVVLLPIRLVFGLVIALLGALISLITPLIPVALLALLGWGIYRAGVRADAAQ